MERIKSILLALAIALIAIQGARASGPTLGTADSFAVLAGSTVTNTGPTVVRGNVGVSPGSAVTGFGPGIVLPPSTIHAGDAVAAQAEADTLTAYNILHGTAYNTNLTSQDLGGLTLAPGVYHYDTSAQLTGTLTLDGNGNSNSLFIIQIGSTLTSASNSAVILINGANADNIFWQVGSSATLGTDTAFQGNILALTSIALDTGSSLLDGRALAINGAVTLDTNAITIPADSLSAVPEPSQPAIMGFGVLALAAMLLHARKARAPTASC